MRTFGRRNDWSVQDWFRPLGIELFELSFDSCNIEKDIAAVVVQYPDTEGRIRDLDKLIAKAHEQGVRYHDIFGTLGGGW